MRVPEDLELAGEEELTAAADGGCDAEGWGSISGRAVGKGREEEAREGEEELPKAEVV